MDPILSALIETISLEAIGVMGEVLKITIPAAITGVLGYRIASNQSKINLQQARESNELTARKIIFDFYERRRVKFTEDHNLLTQGLGANLVLVSNDEKTSQLNLADRQTLIFFEFVKGYAQRISFQITLTIKEFSEKSMGNLDEFVKLQQYESNTKEIIFTNDLEDFIKKVLEITNVIGFLKYCNQLLLENEMKFIFKKYDE